MTEVFNLLTADLEAVMSITRRIFSFGVLASPALIHATAAFPAPAYVEGDRRNRITVTTTLAITGASHGVVSNLINGSTAQDSTGSFFPDAIPDNTGKEIVFTHSAPVMVDEMRIRQNGSYSRGNWRAQIQIDGAWVNAGEPFAWNLPEQIIGFAGDTPATKRRLLGVGGAVSDSGWITEADLREGVAAAAAIAPYADPLALPAGEFKSFMVFNSVYPMELAQQIPNVQYYSDPPPYIHVGKSRNIYDCLPGDYIEAELVSEATWDFPPNNCEWAGMLMLRRVTDDGPVTLSNAGPLIDFRCMTENPGKNILVAEHHAMMTLIGSTMVTLAGDYRVDYLSYASKGNLPTGGEHLKLHDGTLRAKRYRRI